MPHNNPDRDGLDSSTTVFIDTPLELQSHLMHQDLETLGLTDLEALDDSQVMDTSNVLMSDAAVTTMLDAHREQSAMDTSDGNISQSMEVDSVSDGNNTMEMDLLQSDFGSSSQDEVTAATPIQQSANSNHKYIISDRKTIGLPTIKNENNPPQFLKTSQGHYLIVQQSQNSSQVIGTGNKILTQTIASAASVANTNVTKAVYASSVPASAIAKPQFRTIQVKPSTFTQGQNANNVAKYIVTSQGVTSQIKTISTSSTMDNNMKNEKSVGSKYTFHVLPNTSSDGRVKISLPLPFKSSQTISSEVNGKQTPIYTTSDAQVVKIQQSQPIQLSSKLNYIRIMPPSESNGNNSGVPTVQKIVNIKKPMTGTSQNLNIKTIHMPQQPVSGGLTTANVRPQSTITLPASSLSPQVLSNSQPGSLVVIPTHYIQNSSTPNAVTTSTVQAQSIQPSPPTPPAPTAKLSLNKTVIDANGLKPRKPCNCTKSQCLKLYCDCFTNGEFCFNCNCTNCYNNLDHEEDRQKAIRSCLDRNPNAFRPKIGKGGTQNERRHNKGCNCKRSGCLKNYCECYEAKIPCSDTCRCVGCRNVDTIQPPDREKRKLQLQMQLADVTDISTIQKSSGKNTPYSMPVLPSPVKMMFPNSGKSIHCSINTEIVEASCHCLLAQAEKVNKRNGGQQDAEISIINEFSMCVQQIISLTGKSKGA